MSNGREEGRKLRILVYRLLYYQQPVLEKQEETGNLLGQLAEKGLGTIS